jgi:hypothetical protein
MNSLCAKNCTQHQDRTGMQQALQVIACRIPSTKVLVTISAAVASDTQPPTGGSTQKRHCYRQLTVNPRSPEYLQVHKSRAQP